MTATRLPVRSAGGRGDDPALVPGAVDDRQLDLLDGDRVGVDGSTQDASHGAGHSQPVNSGKLFVACSRSMASRQSSSATSSFHSGMRLPSGHRRGRRRRRSPCTGWPAPGRPRRRAGRRPGPSPAGVPRPGRLGASARASRRNPQGLATTVHLSEVECRLTDSSETTPAREINPMLAAGDAAGSEQVGAAPGLAEDVLGEEGRDGLVPDLHVPGVRIQWFSSGK